MKLASLPAATPDGRLVVVSQDLATAMSAHDAAPTFLHAMENWASCGPKLEALAADLAAGRAKDTFAFDETQALSPLPRSYQWLDGSCFKNHLRLMSLSTGRDPEIEVNSTFPLMYQGMSDGFYAPHGPITLPSEDDGIDFEAEIGIIVDEVPMGTQSSDAAKHIKFLVLLNDVSLRGFVKREIATGFGWMNAKASTTFSPVAVTPDELGDAWKDGRLHLSIQVRWNGELFGTPNGAEMSYSFHDLIAHAARTRRICAGTLIGSGTVSNANYSNVGSACIAERRAIEMIEQGGAKTGFMKFGDRVRIEMTDAADRTIFGAIDQPIARYEG